MKCKHCEGSGIACYSKTLSWGIATPDMKCRYCFGKGYHSFINPSDIKTIELPEKYVVNVDFLDNDSGVAVVVGKILDGVLTIVHSRIYGRDK